MIIKVADILNELTLGNSVAETDERLGRYFVNTPTYNLLLTGRKDIIAGDKGTGKTALYRILAERHRSEKMLDGIEVVTAFNPTGSAIFQQLTSVPLQSEGRYIAFWKSYFLALAGNWLLGRTQSPKPLSLLRLSNFLQRTNLKSMDTSPQGIFSRMLGFFPRGPIKSAELDLTLSESGMPKATPRIEFNEPSAGVPQTFFGVDYPIGLRLLESALKEQQLTLWVVLDRLDEAFQGFGDVEIPALRALLRTYLDLQELRVFRLKLFLRKDLFRKVIGDAGFVNMTHVNDKKTEIVWEPEDLKYLLIARLRDNRQLMKNLSFEQMSDDDIFGRFFPEKVSQGQNQSVTWKWMLSRIEDGNGVIAPRNLIDLVERSREAQLRSENRNPRTYDGSRPLIEADAIKRAHKLLSASRAEDTLLAESSELSAYLKKFRNQKAEQDESSLQELYGVGLEEVRVIIGRLRDIGFLREIGNSYKVPMLYRDAFGITQGRATTAQIL